MNFNGNDVYMKYCFLMTNLEKHYMNIFKTEYRLLVKWNLVFIKTVKNALNQPVHLQGI